MECHRSLYHHQHGCQWRHPADWSRNVVCVVHIFKTLAIYQQHDLHYTWACIRHIPNSHTHIGIPDAHWERTAYAECMQLCGYRLRRLYKKNAMQGPFSWLFSLIIGYWRLLIIGDMFWNMDVYFLGIKAEGNISEFQPINCQSYIWGNTSTMPKGPCCYDVNGTWDQIDYSYYCKWWRSRPDFIVDNYGRLSPSDF